MVGSFILFCEAEVYACRSPTYSLALKDSTQQQLPTSMHGVPPYCGLRACWCYMIYKITHSALVGVRYRWSERPSNPANQQQGLLTIEHDQISLRYGVVLELL